MTKIAIVHLYSQGYTDDKLVVFNLGLTNSSTIYQQEKLSLWKEKVDLARDMKDGKMISEDWVYKNIFNMSDQEIEKERASVIEDVKQAFRKEQIETEGNDPAADPKVQPDDEANEESSDPVGRPPEGTKYGTQDHVRGADPTGNDTRVRDIKNRDRSIKHTYRESINSLMKNFNKNKKSSLLSENNLIDDDSLRTD